ncbi:rho GTPase-activating protein 18-like isoform X2 [Mya arenaria]|uniref:rho GTPase-activating protein 18-like isoform X2 n=1 Tax=Mya arenaria TaxID=6604 RepID=UPI0022E0A0F9|nr:rho GTPase-activating protein 18-like isoform X2 [Mya arenaria]
MAKHDLQDFWHELGDIENSKNHDEEEETSKTPDEGEREADWLKEAGFGFLVNQFNAGKELSEDEVRGLTESLPRSHKEVVKRRVDTLNATLRKKQKYTTKIDVRNIFPKQEPVRSDHGKTEDPQRRERPSTLPRGLKLGANGDTSTLYIKKISPQSPITHKFVNNITIGLEVPRSPTSPRGEVVHPEWAAIRAEKGRQGAKKGVYSMTGVTEELQDNVELGVEMLSVHQKNASQLSPLSDGDITFEFSITENGGDSSPLRGEPVISQFLKSEADLPNFSMVADPLGLTSIDDISEEDVTYVRNLAFLELTSMFDTHNIAFSRRRSKKKYNEHGIFGVPLQLLLEHDQKLSPNTPHIPIVFQEILHYLHKNCLEAEGILRIPGSSSRIKTLRQEIEERFYQGTFVGQDLTPNDVAALMKQFLRDLPVPLLTEEYIEAFAQVENLPDKKQQLHALNLLVLLLPDVHRDTLGALLDLLIKIVENSAKNKMSLNNVSMIMAPNLFLAPKIRRLNPSKGKDAMDLEIKMAAGTSNIMRMLIRYKHILWTIPSYLMSLVRRHYESEQVKKLKEKPKMKFLQKKDKTDVYKKPAVKHETDFQEGVIRVQAPKLSLASTKVQLDLSTTAGDIVSRFCFQNESADSRPTSKNISNSHTSRVFHAADKNTFLFEVGGNIGERCLPDSTNMLALYKVNPNAEWIIKHKDRVKVT